MRALCPDCGLHHDVVRVLEDGDGETRRDVFETAPLEECPRRWLTESDVLDARARYGAEALIQDDDDEVL
ncbi:MAG TPA: hypothetical protein PK156_07300 [Polyangium sp.]|nr:hypothetical protein [Polyangium sp.]